MSKGQNNSKGNPFGYEVSWGKVRKRNKNRNLSDSNLTGQK